MRKDSPLVACSIAAVILLLGGAALVPSSAWRAASLVAQLTPALVSTASVHGSAAARAAQLGMFAAPGLLRDAPPVPKREERQVKVCRRDVPRSCVRSECPRPLLQRLHLIFPISG